ncbi:MAG: GxxExxY protein [Pontiellaceae bacterium]|nr:GxxExxY protein [Pontiellaceae bacterium]MBN2784065.1 GxxExxY protein [Pontiellaceae bacterium]
MDIKLQKLHTVLYPELSYSIVGAAMDVHNDLGPGWDEWDYHRAMIEALEKRGHRVVSHERRDLVHRGRAVHLFELDLLVDDLILLELKHIKSDFHPEYFTQLINYLKQMDISCGVLIDVGSPEIQLKGVL